MLVCTWLYRTVKGGLGIPPGLIWMVPPPIFESLQKSSKYGLDSTAQAQAGLRSITVLQAGIFGRAAEQCRCPLESNAVHFDRIRTQASMTRDYTGDYWHV